MNNESNIQPVFNYGSVYIPVQYLNEIFNAEDSLAYGTIFPELVDEYTKHLR